MIDYNGDWIIMDRLVDVILYHLRGCIVEVGIGYSTDILAKHANQYKVVLYSCDTNPDRGKLNEYHTIYKGTSFDFIKQFKGQPAVVFLDGCHQYEVVSVEAKFFLSLLLPGGVLFFHDALPPDERFIIPSRCGTSYLLRQELEKDPNYNCFTWPYTANKCGLTMVMKKPFCFTDQDVSLGAT
jgi:hypothetical protein